MVQPFTAPRVSVLVPTYNYGHYLGGCVASVLCQGVADFEIVIVDNGSTDDTPERMAGFRDSRIRSIRLSPKLEIVDCHNRMFREARGTYVCVLNPDDLWEPDYLRTVLEIYRAHAGVGYVGTDCRYIDEDGRITGQSLYDAAGWVLTGSEAFRRRLRPEGRFEDGIPGQVVFLRKALERLGGYRTDLVLGHDLELWMRFELAGYAVGYVAEPLCRIRMHSRGYSQLNRRRLCASMERIVREYVQKFRRRAPDQWDRRTWLPALLPITLLDGPPLRLPQGRVDLRAQVGLHQSASGRPNGRHGPQRPLDAIGS